MLQNGHQNKTSDAGSKTAVVQTKTTVNHAGGRTHGSTSRTGKYTALPAESAGDGAEAGGKGQTVKIGLRRQRPAGIEAK